MVYVTAALFSQRERLGRERGESYLGTNWCKHAQYVNNSTYTIELRLRICRPKKENYLQTVKWPTPCKQCQTCSKVSEAGSNARPTNRPTNWPIDVLTHDWLTQSRSELACMSIIWVTNIPQHSYLEVGCSIIGHRPYLDMQVEQLHCVCVWEREGTELCHECRRVQCPKTRYSMTCGSHMHTCVLQTYIHVV